MSKKDFASEEEFLKAYDSSMYEKLSMTADILVFSVSHEESRDYRRLGNKNFSVLLIKRNTYPFKDKWCLPGGFVGIDESIDDAAARILKNETNLKNIYIEQLYTFGAVNRDPRMRIVSTAYMALVDKNMLKDHLIENASWFNISIEEKYSKVKILLDNGIDKIEFTIAKKDVNHTTGKYDYEIQKNESIAFDHPLVILTGIERLRNKIEYTDIVFNMMPEFFTLGELQQVYETILGKSFIAPDFRRMILSKVEKTDKVRSGMGHRPSALYRYKGKK